MRELTPKENFINETYTREPDVLVKLRKLAIKNKCDHMFLAPSEARMLQGLVELHGSKKVLEIGMLYGYSAYYLSKGMGKTGKVWTCEINLENANIAKNFFVEACVDNVEILVGDAHQTLSNLEKEAPFDAIFLDADKAGYIEYLKWAYTNLRSGGMIVADNTFLGGSIWGEKKDNYGKNQIEKMHEFHKMFSDTELFSSTIFPSYDGLAVGIKK